MSGRQWQIGRWLRSQSCSRSVQNCGLQGILQKCLCRLRRTHRRSSSRAPMRSAQFQRCFSDVDSVGFTSTSGLGMDEDCGAGTFKPSTACGGQRHSQTANFPGSQNSALCHVARSYTYEAAALIHCTPCIPSVTCLLKHQRDRSRLQVLRRATGSSRTLHVLMLTARRPPQILQIWRPKPPHSFPQLSVLEQQRATPRHVGCMAGRVVVFPQPEPKGQAMLSPSSTNGANAPALILISSAAAAASLNG